MRYNVNYSEYFEEKVEALSKYLKDNNLKAQIIGISGGIDSCVCAAICHEVSKRTGIPLIGRSLPTKFNKEGETTTADLVGNAFCDDYKVVSIERLCNFIKDYVEESEDYVLSKLSYGNVQARTRMIYLYELSSHYSGVVIDTDNLTEHNLGYFTINGDVGTLNPIGDLWKTQVFELAEWYLKNYVEEGLKLMNEEPNYIEKYHIAALKDHPKYKAISESLKLKPTAGLGITNNDLEEIGAESYEQVDGILQEILAWKWLSKKRGDFPEDDLKAQREQFLDEQQMLDTPIEIILNVVDRHFNSEFKRKQLPIVL